MFVAFVGIKLPPNMPNYPGGIDDLYKQDIVVFY